MAVRDPSTGQSATAGIPPIAKSFALTILAALVLLVILRHTFGSLRVEVGTS